MPFWKRILIVLSFCLLYTIMYYIIGFELTVIVGIANIISDLVIKDYPKKVVPPTKKSMYVQQGTRWNR